MLEFYPPAPDLTALAVPREKDECRCREHVVGLADATSDFRLEPLLPRISSAKLKREGSPLSPLQALLR